MLISKRILEELTAHRAAYEASGPIPNWLTLPGFLEPSVVERLWGACRAAHFATFCGYTVPGDPTLRNEFHEPSMENTYITVHQRSAALEPLLRELEQAMGSEPTLDVLRKLTGEPLECSGGTSTLTCWNPDSFVTPHSDSGATGRGARLVLWVWLTRAWDADYGGNTGFQWPTMREPLTLLPELNRAVMFRPFSGSLHWVTPVAARAPSKSRFTWTLHYH